jgi:chemotaxis protein methyltransferase CheR
MNAMQDHPWPGNVQELQNLSERAVIDSSGPNLRLAAELKPPLHLRRGLIRKGVLNSIR